MPRMSGAENIGNRVRQPRVADTGEEFRDVATGVVDFVHGVDTRLLVFAVPDKGIAVNVSHWHFFAFPRQCLRRPVAGRRFPHLKRRFLAQNIHCVPSAEFHRVSFDWYLFLMVLLGFSYTIS